MGQPDKLERLMNLVAALLETRAPLSRAEITRRVPGYPAEEASARRAFERDKDDLREMGIPLVMEDVPGSDPVTVGYRIPQEQYYLPDPGLEPDELAALHLAAEAVRLQGVEGAGALWKLGGRPSGDSGPAGAGTSEVAALPADPNLVAVFGAVGERRPITFSYNGTERTVDPYRLDFVRGRWYVSGFDHVRGEERNFRLDRVDGPVEAGPPGGYERPATAVPGVRLAPWQFGEGEPVRARVVVDAVQAAAARQTAGPDGIVEERPDGSVVIELAVTNQAGFLSFVLGFLDRAEVLDPPELRQAVVDWLDAVAVAG